MRLDIPISPLLPHAFYTFAVSTYAGAVTEASSSASKPRTFSSKGYHGSKEQRRIMYEGPPIHTPTPEEAAAISRNNVLTAGALLAVAGAAYYAAINRKPLSVNPPVEEDLLNWSGTHACHVKKFYQPESLEELELLVKQAHEGGQKLRCMGSGLSPNALAFEQQGMVSLSLMDKILSIDKSSGRVTVQAGARVQEVADYLRRHGLSLQNYASIREQTIGGLTQVGAHGTGATIPTIDNSVISLKLVTPSLGTLELSEEKDKELFHLARVGLGCLGVVAEVTVQCVPAHRLLERTFVSTLDEIKLNHTKWLAEHKHLRYMWIPATDAIVVVWSNELPEVSRERLLIFFKCLCVC